MAFNYVAVDYPTARRLYDPALGNSLRVARVRQTAIW